MAAGTGPTHPIHRRRETVDRLSRPIQRFISTEISGGILLLVGLAIAMAWANSPWADSYHHLLEHHISLDLGFWSLDEPIEFWVNDVLMTLFFFVVGLEIKREAVAGELANLRQAAVPIIGAMGGMLVPALIYTAIVQGGEGAQGWGVPVATDIAFALGVVMLAGTRVPFGLKVMLLALAIADDLGGILIIAIFYSDGVAMTALAGAGGILLLCLFLRQIGIWFLPIYWFLGAVGWAFTLESGIHPTIFGVALGLLAPWQAWHPETGFVDRMRALVDRVREIYDPETQQATHEEQVAVSLAIADEAYAHVAPLDRLEKSLAPITAYIIAPVFAFSNAGVPVDAATLGEAVRSPISQGVFFGLLLGKPIGILAAVWLAVKMGARLPTGVGWAGVAALGLVAGVGFTVALFVAGLSFEEEVLLTDAKLGILFASLLAGVVGWTALRVVFKARPEVADGH